VQFAEAVGVFGDDFASTIVDEESNPSEQRLLTLGMGTKGRILVVVYRYAGDNIRIISARAPERRERVLYEERRRRTSTTSAGVSVGVSWLSRLQSPGR
jgi:uncharacterized DUF497 family protein